jgi:hypothetical protein
MWAAESMRDAAQISAIAARDTFAKMTGLKSAPSSSAEVAEWQTQRTQNPPWATTCGFKSRPRHHRDFRAHRIPDFFRFDRQRWQSASVARPRDAPLPEAAHKKNQAETLPKEVVWSRRRV